MARITGPKNALPSAVLTPLASEFSIISSVTRELKCTSPPQSIMVFRMAFITAGSRSVPICGCASTRMSSDAPCWASMLSILSTDPRFLLLVYNFPSEYAPAPPSPKQ